jgi:glycerophosphoryl diester phosphodiesterase
MLDVKGWGDTAARVAATMREHAPQRPYLVCSQNWGLLERFHAEPAAHVVHSVGGARALGRVAAHIEAQERSMISIHRKLLSRDVVAELHRYAGSIMTWPVNDEATAARLFAWGVDGVITDRIAIVRWVQQQEAAPGSRSLA